MAVAARTVGATARAPAVQEHVVAAGLVAVGLCLRLWGMRSAPISDKFDEGVYLSLMQSTAAHAGALYRDYILCHPPGPVWLGAWLWPQISGSLFALRAIYMCVCMAAFVPLYAIARRYYGVGAALITLALLTCSPAFANWLGRNIFLDLPLNLPLYTCLWLLLCPVRRPRLRGAGAGAVLGLAYLLKETAAPCGVALIAAMLYAQRRPLSADVAPMPASGPAPPAQGQAVDIAAALRSAALPFAGAFAATLGAILLCLAAIPNYIHYSFTLNAAAAYRWGLRPYELMNGLYALPLALTFGVVATVRYLLPGARPVDRLLGAFAVTISCIMLFVPRLFYWRYLAPALPIFCLAFAVWFEQFARRRTARGGRSGAGRAVTWAALAFLAAVQVVDLALYHTSEGVMPATYNAALAALRAAPGPLFTLNPIWAAAADRPLTPPVQRLIKATIDVPVSKAEYDAALAPCNEVVLDRQTLRWLPPPVATEIAVRYRSIFKSEAPLDRRYVQVLVRR